MAITLVPDWGILRNAEDGDRMDSPFFDGFVMWIFIFFIAIGYEPANQLAEKIGLELTEEGYIRHDEKHRTNIPGIYSAGDVEGGYKQIVTASGQGSAAALTIFEDLINPYWLRNEDRTEEKIPA